MNDQIDINPQYRPILSAVGLDSVARVFGDSRLRVWRDLADRDNSTLDATLPDGRAIRLHVKRDKRPRREPIALEAQGIRMLEAAGVPSAPLAAHGRRADGRTFVVTENLDGYLSADRLMETNVDRLAVLRAMTDVAARLHGAGLHHRDLYANHFYLKPDGDGFDVRLIDAARVRRLPWLFRERWIVKDVAQLLFSVGQYVEGTDHVEEMLARYAVHARRDIGGRFEQRVRAKAAWIERHDAALRARRPKRNLRLADGN